MPVDYTVIMPVRQRFGDDIRDEKESVRERESGIETEAPFVGAEKSFPFQCPGVDRSQSAILLFESMGVSVRQTLEINGQQIFGGITTSNDFESRTIGGGSDAHQDRTIFARWKGHVLLIHPGVLAQNNVLRIQSGPYTSGNLDDFVIDNMVVIFKTTSGVSGTLDPGTVVVNAGRKRARSGAKKSSKRRKRA